MARLAVITGASSGIGAMFARKLAARGYDLLLIARREDRLKSLATELAELNHITADVLAADLATDAGRESAAARIGGASNLSVLVNNAGFGTLGFFAETDVTGQLRMHQLHVMATVHLTHAALASLVPRGEGGVINVSSVAAFSTTAGSASYCSTKGWINHFSSALYAEMQVRKSPVKIQALCPGFTLSEFHDTLGMDRSGVARQFWMTADFVVTESLKAFDQGKLYVVPGWRYKLLTAFLRAMPEWVVRKASSGGAARYRRQKN
jgi:hypothetical protein